MSAHSSSYVSAPVSTGSSLPSSLASKLTSFDSLSGTQLASSVVVLILTLLIAEQTWWRYRKGPLPGHRWQIVSLQHFCTALQRNGSTRADRCFVLNPRRSSDCFFESDLAPMLALSEYVTRDRLHSAYHWSIRRVAASFHAGLQAM